MTALDRCVAIPQRRFADEHWGRRPLLTRHHELAQGFDDLLDAAAVDELISRRGLRTPFLRMAKDGKLINAQRFTRGGGAGASAPDQAADDRVLAQLADGATLVLQGLHRTWPPLVDLAGGLASQLGHPVQVNAYVTPSQNQGFAAHYDVHDVFVLQVAGRKRWRIHGPVLTDPLGDQPWEQRRAAVAARAGEPPLLDEVLEPGDSLYLPRGYLHSAVAQGELSIHLTVGIHALTRYQLVRHLLTLARDDVQLRSSLPMGVDLGDPAVLAPHLDETLTALRRYLDGAGAEAVAELIAGDLMRQTRPVPVGPLAQLAAAEAVDETTLLRLRPGLRYAVDGTTLRLLDTSVALPRNAEDAVKVVLAGGSFAPRELPGLAPADALALARTLLRAGVISPAADRDRQGSADR